jgi:CrcB protein
VTQVLLVFLGGGIGAAFRHGVNIGSARMFGTAFPWHTLIVNVAGSFVMGLLTAWFAFRTDWWTTQHVRLFLTTGILGGFTTFSTFSLDTALLWERGATFAAASYVVLSLVLSVAGLFVAMWLVRSAS